MKAVEQVKQQAAQALQGIQAEFAKQMEAMKQDKSIELAKLKLDERKLDQEDRKMDIELFKAQLSALPKDSPLTQAAAQSVVATELEGQQIEESLELEEITDAALPEAIEDYPMIDIDYGNMQDTNMPTGGLTPD
jgi:vancomycin resistance protein YoaR